MHTPCLNHRAPGCPAAKSAAVTLHWGASVEDRRMSLGSVNKNLTQELSSSHGKYYFPENILQSIDMKLQKNNLSIGHTFALWKQRIFQGSQCSIFWKHWTYLRKLQALGYFQSERKHGWLIYSTPFQGAISLWFQHTGLGKQFFFGFVFIMLYFHLSTTVHP